MRKLSLKQFHWNIHWKGVLVESCAFLLAYILWAIFRSPESKSRLFVGSLAILVPGVAAVIIVFRFLPQHPPSTRRAWQFLGLGLTFWSLGNLVRTYYEGVLGIPVPLFSLADIITYLAYPLFFLALFFYPFENPYSPSRFRFLLDLTISTGVVAALVMLMVGNSVSFSPWSRLITLVYEIADFIVLMILFNILLANRRARRTLSLWGCGFSLFLISDYLYGLLARVNGYQIGGFESIGWILGGLIFGWSAVFLTRSPVEQSRLETQSFDLGTRIQNILPYSLVVVLGWYVITDWRLSGHLPWLGVWASIFFTLTLVVRTGVRAGEAELYKYWQLFSGLAEPVFICNEYGKILLGNPALVKILGLQTASDARGRVLALVFEHQTFPADLFQRAIHQPCSSEVVLRSNHTPYLLSLGPIFSEGRKVLIAGAAHDLTEQKKQQAAIQQAYDEMQAFQRKLEELNSQLEQKVEERAGNLREAYRQLEEQNRQLQRLDQLKSDFISMVSHELRTPLTSLNGGLELLSLGKNRSRSDRSIIDLMGEEVGRLTRIIQNILTLSATDADQIQLKLVPLSLIDVLKAVSAKLSAADGAREIRYGLPEDLPLILADEVVLESVFTHLLDNALKYAPGSPIFVEAFRKKDQVRVQVTDYGPGIPSAKRSFLFQRFQRLDAKDSQTVYGYGLGLYLSRRMLRAMQSDLAFEAPPEGGARFFFKLKVAK